MLVVSTVPLAYVRQSMTHRVGNPSLISNQRKRQITKIYDLCVDYLDRRIKSICLKDVDNNMGLDPKLIKLFKLTLQLLQNY